MATEIYLPVQNLSQEFIVLAFKWPTFVKNINTSKLQKATSEFPNCQQDIIAHCIRSTVEKIQVAHSNEIKKDNPRKEKLLKNHDEKRNG